MSLRIARIASTLSNVLHSRASSNLLHNLINKSNKKIAMEPHTRNFTQLKSEKFDDEGLATVTGDEQVSQLDKAKVSQFFSSAVL